VGSAGTVTPAPGRGDERPPGRVLLLSESAGLAAVLGRLLERGDQLTRLGTLREAIRQDKLAGVDAIVIDVPRDGRRMALQHLRERYRGPLVVLLEPGGDSGGLPADQGRTFLTRPFCADDLGAALGLSPLEQRQRRTGSRLLAGSGVAPAAATVPAAHIGKDADLDASPLRAGKDAAEFGPADGAVEQDAVAAGLTAAPPAPPRPGGWPAGMRHVGRGRRQAELLLAELAHGWRTRRWVRVAGFSAVSALAFGIAFALAATQSGCGQGCDELGAGVAPPPTYPLDLHGTPTTAAAHTPGSTVGAASGSGDFKDAASGAATSTTARASTTTQPSVGSGTTRPSTTRQTTTTTRQTTTTTTIDPTTTTTASAVP
jgi:hypothetical protein